VISNRSRTDFKIIVDADSCPVKDIVFKTAGEKGVPVVLVSSVSHQMNLEGDNDDITVITVDNIPQAADIQIVNSSAGGDIVITGDYGLAAMVLSKGAVPVSARGFVFTPGNIDRLLVQRHIDARIRRGGGRTKGPKAFGAEDRLRFEKALKKLITERLKQAGQVFD